MESFGRLVWVWVKRMWPENRMDFAANAGLASPHSPLYVCSFVDSFLASAARLAGNCTSFFS